MDRLLQAGDVALLPRGTGHALADTRRQQTKALDEFPLEEIGDRTLPSDRQAATAHARCLLCGSVSFEEPAVHPLLELMPPLLIVRGAARTIRRCLCFSKPWRTKWSTSAWVPRP